MPWRRKVGVGAQGEGEAEREGVEVETVEGVKEGEGLSVGRRGEEEGEEVKVP